VKALITKPKLIGNGQLLVRQHGRLQAVQMTTVCNDLGQVDTDGEDFDVALIKLCAKFFQST
jgi:hypothetical protein